MVKIDLPKPVKDNAWYIQEHIRKMNYQEYKLKRNLKKYAPKR